ncbi:MAG: aldehyde dehydrogenase family protein [Chloroflexota bacterium]
MTRARHPGVVRLLESGTQPMLIDGEWRMGAAGAVSEVIDPASGEVLARVACAEASDVDAAAGAAWRAFEDGRWSRLRPDQRALALLRWADLVERDAALLTELESLQSGKPVWEARGDIARGLDGIRFYAAAARNIRGETITVSDAHHSYTLREPVGVVACVVPWNVPFVLTVSKAAPALAAGCTVVVKPSQSTPLTSLHLGRLWAEAGLPAGVYNVLTGPGGSVGEALCVDPRVTGITFTGSTEVGLRLGGLAALQNKRTMLELGGKSPNLVLADADLDAAAAGAASAIFYGQGQICSAGSRLIVEASVHDRVVAGVAARAADWRIGDPFDEATRMGALHSREHQDMVLDRVRAAVRDGAVLVCGGEPVDVPGLPGGAFMEPTVLAEVDPAAPIARDEIFGPVLVVHRVADADEAVRIANDTPFGLGAGVWTKDLSKARRLAARLQSGVVWINDFNQFNPAMPFGGVKVSGSSHREWSHLALDAFLETRAVWERIA